MKNIYHYIIQNDALYEIYEGSYATINKALDHLKLIVKENKDTITKIERNHNLNCTTFYTEDDDNFYRIYGAAIYTEVDND